MSNECSCQLPNTDLGGRCFKCGGFVEIPISKPMTPQERIKADARAATDKRYPGDAVNFEYIEYEEGYIAGATAENEKIEAAIDSAIHKERNALQAKVTQMDMDWLKRAQVLVDALEEILKQHDYYSVIELAAKALEQWKSGKGKEVEG